jgi:thymidylate synthase (FAD)
MHKLAEHAGRMVVKPGEATLEDVMKGAGRWEITVHEHGLIALLDVMPRLVPAGKSADAAIVQAARVSCGQGTKAISEDRALIRYLARHRHTSPFEMVEFKFHCVMPIFVARQWIRHRTASVNEYSGRYSVVKERFFRPTADSVRKQSASNRQGGTESIDEMTAERFYAYLDKSESQYAEYQSLLDSGVARELARIGLPLSLYTEWYWKCDLHNIFHFLSLRLDPHAQAEFRDYARAMFALIEPIVPVACEAFLDYQLEGMRLSKPEVEALRSGQPLATENKREQEEWAQKKRTLGL